VEVAATGKFGAATRARLAYTYLEARNSVTQARLTRRPRHTTDAEVQFQATKVLLIGAGVHGVSDRRNGAAVMEDYTTARVFASYAVNDRLRLKLRAENALDEAYEEVFGYPALPRAVHGSIEWRF
jgi:vitamin B12 transporter